MYLFIFCHSLFHFQNACTKCMLCFIFAKSASPEKEFASFIHIFQKRVNTKQIFPSTEKKKLHLTKWVCYHLPLSSCFASLGVLPTKSWLTEVPQVNFHLLLSRRLSSVQFSLQSDLDSSIWNMMQSESLKCFRLIQKPKGTWQHNCESSLHELHLLVCFYL